MKRRMKIVETFEVDWQVIISKRMGDLASIAGERNLVERVRLVYRLNKLIKEKGRRGMTPAQVKELAQMLENTTRPQAEEVLLAGLKSWKALEEAVEQK